MRYYYTALYHPAMYIAVAATLGTPARHPRFMSTYLYRSSALEMINFTKGVAVTLAFLSYGVN